MTIPGYRDIEIIETNNGSKTYRGIQEKDGEKVYIKEYLLQSGEQLHNNPWFQEYQILKRLSGDFTVPCLGFTEYVGYCHIVYKDLSLLNITQLLNVNPVDEIKFYEIALRLVNILLSLQKENIFHSQISPFHILSTTDSKCFYLTDFKMAGIYNQEWVSLDASDYPIERLRYISPEQTGRINRAVDYRTDIYSMGLVFIFFLTGKHPFPYDQKLKVVHGQLAENPLNRSSLKEHISISLYKIIEKMLEKNPDNRYQSAQGIIDDLKISQKRYQHNEKSNFIPGESDFSRRFIIPQKLYGRIEEINTLHNELGKVCNKDSRIVLVKGYSGIGKSSLVKELLREITIKDAYFGSGKYEYLKRNIAYSAISQVFSDLIRQILREDEQRVTLWRTSILEVLGNKGQILIDIIPPLEDLIGYQPAVKKLPDIETQNRFNQLFQDFISIFDKLAHPLIIFLDDLQWIDLASLKLIKLIFTDSDIKSFLFIGAYRDNEIDENHPTMVTMKEIGRTGIPIDEIKLEPLKLTDVNLWVSEIVRTDLKDCENLSKLVHRKTYGNPFFVKSFLLNLHHEGLITLNDSNRWEWSMTQISETQPTDNVKELLINNMNQLTNEASELLSFAACIGSFFTFPVLTIISGKNPSILDHEFRSIINKGLVSKKENTFYFVHDKIQEAAYSLIDEVKRPSTHLSIGRLLLDQYSEEELDSNLFNVVEHLNKGLSMVNSPNEINHILRLNLQVAQKARSSTAYFNACHYYQIAESLLPDKCWDNCYELAFTLYSEWAETEYMSTNYEKSRGLFETLMKYSKSVIDKCKIVQLVLIQYNNERKFDRAIDLSLQMVNQLGHPFPNPESINHEDNKRQCERLLDNLSRVPIHQILELNVIDNERVMLKIGLLTNVLVPFWNIYPIGLKYLSYEVVNLTLENGISAESSIAFSMLGSLMIEITEENEIGYELAKLSIEIAKRFDDNFHISTTEYLFYNHVHFWKHPLIWGKEYLIDAYYSAVDAGNNQWASYCLNHFCMRHLISGTNLNQAKEFYDRYGDLHHKLKQSDALTFFNPPRETVNNLLGINENTLILKGKYFDEEVDIAEYLKTRQFSAIGLCFTFKLMIYCIHGEFDKSKNIISQSKALEYIGSNSSQYQPFLGKLFFCICILRNEVDQHIQIAKSLSDEMYKRSKICEINFFPLYLLMEAEIKRAEKKDFQALELYDEAIKYSLSANFLHLAAMASEWSSSLWEERDNQEVAYVYKEKSYNLYKEWGCKSKTDNMVLTTQDRGISHKHFDENNSINKMDIYSIQKATQAISQEINYSILMDKLMGIIAENAGAEKGYMVFQRDNGYTIEAAFNITSTETQPQEELIIEHELSLSMVRYAIRTGETLIIEDASEINDFSKDVYIKSHSGASILVIPIKLKTHNGGVLFLENDKTKGIFNTSRIEWLKIILSQAVISIENAELFRSIKKSETQINTLQNYLSNIIDSMPSILIGINPELNVTQWNEKAILTSGIPVDKAMGRPLLEVMPHLQKLQSQIKHSLLSHVVFYSGKNKRTKNDTEYFEDITIYPLVTNDEAGAVIRIDDVTKEEKLQEHLRQSQKMDAVGQLAGGIAHDFNNMLGGILGASEMLKEITIGDEEAAVYLSLITEAAEHAADLAAKLLTFSRKKASKLEPLDIHTIINSSVSILEKTIDKRISIKKVFNSKESQILGSTSQIQSMIMNLAINGAHAMEHGGELIIQTEKCLLSQKECNDSIFELSPGSYIQITIIDTGIGIEHKDLERIFEPFYTTKEQGKGTGLGLAAVYGTVVQHKGSITVESKLNEGTSFHIQLPIADIEIQNDFNVEEQLVKGEGLILLVDDEEILRKSGKALLERLGYSVLLAKDGEEGIRLYSEYKKAIKIVLLDMIMPTMNGQQCFTAIKRINKDVPIVIVSGYIQEQVLQQLQKEGLSGFIEKPYNINELSRTLKSAIEPSSNK